MASPVLELSLEQELERSFTICQSARCCDDGDSEDSLKVQNADGGHLYSSEHDNYSDPPRRSKRLRSWANLISLNIHHRDHTLRHPSVTLGRGRYFQNSVDCGANLSYVKIVDERGMLLLIRLKLIRVK